MKFKKTLPHELNSNFGTFDLILLKLNSKGKSRSATKCMNVLTVQVAARKWSKSVMTLQDLEYYHVKSSLCKYLFFSLINKYQSEMLKELPTQGIKSPFSERKKKKSQFQNMPFST